jgi:hypothetical protein
MSEGRDDIRFHVVVFVAKKWLSLVLFLVHVGQMPSRKPSSKKKWNGGTAGIVFVHMVQGTHGPGLTTNSSSLEISSMFVKQLLRSTPVCLEFQKEEGLDCLPRSSSSPPFFIHACYHTCDLLATKRNSHEV